MSWLPLVGYGAAALAAALCLFYRQKAKRAEERRINEVKRWKDEASVYASALTKTQARVRELGDHNYDTGLRIDENGALLRD